MSSTHTSMLKCLNIWMYVEIQTLQLICTPGKSRGKTEHPAIGVLTSIEYRIIPRCFPYIQAGTMAPHHGGGAVFSQLLLVTAEGADCLSRAPLFPSALGVDGWDLSPQHL